MSGTRTPLGVPSFSDHLATRIHQLEEERGKLRERLAAMRRSRDTWRDKYRTARRSTRFCGSCTKRVRGA